MPEGKRFPCGVHTDGPGRLADLTQLPGGIRRYTVFAASADSMVPWARKVSSHPKCNPDPTPIVPRGVVAV